MPADSLRLIAASEKQTGKKEYWRSELKSLGIEPKFKNELEDKEELESLTDNIKQSMYQDYKTAYNEQGNNPDEASESTSKSWPSFLGIRVQRTC